MPTTKSAMKRQRQAVTTTLLNKSKKSRITSAKRDFDKAVQNADTEKAKVARDVFCSVLDKAAKAGVIKPNKASRGKSRSSKALASLKA